MADRDSFFYLVEKLDKVEKYLSTKGVKTTEKTMFCTKMDFVMSIFCEGCKSKYDIVKKLLKNYRPCYLWEVLSEVVRCDCCNLCANKFGKEKGACECHCSCYELYEIFKAALEKDAYDRLAKIEGRPDSDEVFELIRRRKVSED